MCRDIANQGVSVLICHHPAIELSSLEEVIIGMCIRMTVRLPGNIKRWLSNIRLGLRAAEAVGVVVRAVPTVVAETHEAIALIVINLGCFRRVNGQKMIVGPQAMEMCTMVGKQPPLEHLVRRCRNTRNEVSRGKSSLFHLGKVIL